MLYALAQDLTPTDGAYQNTLEKVATKEVIPWLGTVDSLWFCLVTGLPDVDRPPPFDPQLELRPLQSHCLSGRASSYRFQAMQ
jgi:hypothetical protein